MAKKEDWDNVLFTRRRVRRVRRKRKQNSRSILILPRSNDNNLPSLDDKESKS